MGTLSAEMNAPLAPGSRGAVLAVSSNKGGVGKTTTSAALALSGARLGLRVLALTIDPSKRLAQTLGVARNTPHPVLLERSRLSALGGAALARERVAKTTRRPSRNTRTSIKSHGADHCGLEIYFQRGNCGLTQYLLFRQFPPLRAVLVARHCDAPTLAVARRATWPTRRATWPTRRATWPTLAVAPHRGLHQRAP